MPWDEHAARAAELEARVEALEGRIDRLEAAMERVRLRLEQLGWLVAGTLGAALLNLLVAGLRR
jgi:chaperonin cofactor prefoldin